MLSPTQARKGVLRAQHGKSERARDAASACCCQAAANIGAAVAPASGAAESALESWAAQAGISAPSLRVADFGGEPGKNHLSAKHDCTWFDTPVACVSVASAVWHLLIQ